MIPVPQRITTLVSKLNESINKSNMIIGEAWKSYFSLENNEKVKAWGAFKVASYDPSSSPKFFTEEKGKNAYKVISDEIIRKLGDIKTDPDNIEKWMSLGFSYHYIGDFSNSFSCFSKLYIENNLQKRDSYSILCFACLNHYFGLYDEAIKLYKVACERIDMEQIRSDIIFRLALACRSIGDYSNSIKFLQQVYDHPPKNLESDDILFQIGYTYQSASKFSEAFTVYFDLYNRFSTNMSIIYQTTWFLSMDLGTTKIENADEIFKKEINRFPNDHKIQFSYGRFLMRQGLFKDSHQIFRNCLMLMSEEPVFWFTIGNQYLENHQFDDAITSYQRMLHLKSDIEDAWVNMSLAQISQGYKEKAIGSLTQGLKYCESSMIINEILQRFSQTNIGKIPKSYECVNGFKNFQDVDRIAQNYIETPPLIPLSYIVTNEGGMKTVECVRVQPHSFINV